MIPLLAFWIAFVATSQAPQTPGPTLEDVCWSAGLLDLSEAGEEFRDDSLPKECARVLRCLKESRVESEQSEGTPARRHVQATCDHLNVLAELSGIELDQLIVSVESIEGERSEADLAKCESLLTCLKRSAEMVVSGATWKQEFDRICGLVPIASQLSPQDLEALVLDCDRLSTNPSLLKDPRAKIFLRRLQMCRSFFEYSQDLDGGD